MHSHGANFKTKQIHPFRPPSSSSGLGRGPLKAETGVRLPVGALPCQLQNQQQPHHQLEAHAEPVRAVGELIDKDERHPRDPYREVPQAWDPARNSGGLYCQPLPALVRMQLVYLPAFYQCKKRLNHLWIKMSA